ncbi:MAG: NAD(P)H-dependent oxidoreductase [Pseudomonadota bacterium]
MRVLVLYCHPSPDSFTAAVRDVVVARLAAGGAEVDLVDVYSEGFDPCLGRRDWEAYEDCEAIRRPVAAQAEAVARADALVFVYPTWWYGLPAALKGWLDRVLAPGIAFSNPAEGPIRPGLTHIRALGVFTTCGASRRLTWAIGAPGRRTLMRGLRLICAPRCRTAFAAHYDMDRSTPASRARHLSRVARKADALVAGLARARPRPRADAPVAAAPA